MSSYRKTMGEVYNGMYLVEGNIDKIKDIVSKKSASKIDGVMVDMFTASAISQIYDKVNDANKKKMEKLPITKLAALAMKMMKNEYVPEEVDEKYDSDKFFGGKGTPEQRLQLLKLGNKALKTLGGSPKQKEIQKEINALRKKMGMKVSEEVDLDEKKKEVVFKGTPAQIKKQMQNLKKKDKLKIGEEDDLDEDYVITVKDKEVNRYKSEKDARKAFSDLVQMHGRDVKVFKEEVEIDESGHTDVASAMTNVKVATSALTKMSGELSKLSPEDALPSWWTNKVAVAVDKLDGMADYLDTQVEEVELDEKVKVGDKVKVKLRRPGGTTVQDGKVIKIEKDSIRDGAGNKRDSSIVMHDFSRRPSRVAMTDIVKEEVELDELMPATKHVAKSKKNPDMFCVFDKDGNEVKLFKDKKDAEEYAIKNHDALNEEDDLDEAMGSMRPETGLKGNIITKLAIDMSQGGMSMPDVHKQMEILGKKKLPELKKLAKELQMKQLKLKKEEVDLDEGSWHIAKNMNALKKKMQKPIPKGDLMVKFVMKHIGDDELADDMFDAKTGTDMVPMIKSAMKRLNIKEEVELDEAKFSPKEIKMAIGIASDKRYAGGNMTGAVKAIEKIKKGLSDHPQVMAVLKRQNEEVELDEKAPKIGVDRLKLQRDKDKSHADAMGRHVKSGRRKSVKDEVELDEGKMKDIVTDVEDAMGKIKYKLSQKGGKLIIKVSSNDERDAQKAMKMNPLYIAGKLRVVSESFLIAATVNRITRTEARDIDPADIDVRATDKDVDNASKNIILQLRKVINLRGVKPVEFASGKEKVHPNVAAAALTKHENMRRADDKEAFQRKIARSYKDLLNAVKGK